MTNRFDRDTAVTPNGDGSFDVRIDRGWWIVRGPNGGYVAAILAKAASAVVADPDILVCDEPTGDLDRDTADEILGLLELLNRDHGKTIIMVTHDPKAAEHASHVLHLDKGRLVDQVSA